MTPDADKAARELLAFYLEAGVDAPVGESRSTGLPIFLLSPPPLRGRSTREARREGRKLPSAIQITPQVGPDPSPARVAREWRGVCRFVYRPAPARRCGHGGARGGEWHRHAGGVARRARRL